VFFFLKEFEPTLVEDASGFSNSRNAQLDARRERYQEAEVALADNPGPTLFHRHQQLHLDNGFNDAYV